SPRGLNASGAPIWNQSGRNRRTAEGRFICGFCSKAGHTDSRCFQNPSSSYYRGQDFRLQQNNRQEQPVNNNQQGLSGPRNNVQQRPVNNIQTMPSGDSQNYSAYPVHHIDFPFPDHYLQQETDGNLVPPTVSQPNTCHHQEGNEAWRSDTSRLIKEIVTCGPVITNAVVDTGAAISVMSPTLLHRTGYLLQEWHGPAIVLANGTRAVPLGGAQISITYRNKTVSGTAIVLPMNEIEFLMGNDFLRQFGHLHVDYTGEQAHVILGDLPSFALNFPEPPVRHTKLWSLEGCIIPAFSVVPVLTTLDTQFLGVSLFTPSEKLLSTKSLSVGHAVLSNATRSLPVANLSAVPVWLNKHSTLGTLQPYTDDVVACDLPDSFDGANQVVSNDTLPLEKNMSETSLETSINPDLSPQQKLSLMALLQGYRQTFALSDTEIGYCTVAEHPINLKEGTTPVCQRPYPSAWKARKIIQTLSEDMLQAGIIERSDSPWGAPVVLIKKKDGSWRFCVDYRGLNEVTIRDVYPLPRISDILSKLEGAEYFSIMDLQSGYHQLPLRKEDREKTAFITADGLYHFKVLPFGLSNGPSSFQRAMDVILGGLRWSSCLVYLDDVVVYAPTFETHLLRLNSVLSCLGKAGLKLKGSKCQFAMNTLKVLGHIVSKQGIAPDPDKIAAVRDFPECNQGKTTSNRIKQVQSFLGLCSYYRRHIAGFAKIAQPLTALTKKGASFLWENEQRNSFTALKKALTSAPILAHPDYESPMIIMSDACGYGIGAVLSQSKDGKEFPLAYASRQLSKAELNYSITEKECLALIWALQKFRGFIWGCKIVIITDHEALCWLRTKKDLAGRLARWSLCLLEYEVEIRYRSGRLHTNADCLSRFPLTSADTNDEERCVTIGTLNYANNELFTNEDWDDLTAKQRDNHLWRSIITKLENNRSAGRRFCLKNGKLFKIKHLWGQTYLRLCVPSEYTHIVLTKYHDDPTAGHLGIHKTLAKIGQRFHWPGLEKEVVSYVKSCKLCQSRKSPKIKPAGLLQCIRVSRPFQNVGIDLLGPFTMSHTGNKMIIVAVDYLTKWVELSPLPSGKADVVSKFLVEHIVLRHGMPEKLISDRGKCFMADITQTILRTLGIQHKTTSSYHPQSNGQVERMNHTLATMISMYISEDQKDWDAQLKHICFAYNTSRQDSTGFSPFFLLYGREPVLPIDLLVGTCPQAWVPESQEVLPYAEQLLLDLQSARHIVRRRIQHVQEKQKKGYDARHNNLTFQKGDLVLVYKPIRKNGRSEKLLHRWIGPYIVLRQTTPVNYEVQLQHSKKKTDIVHVVCMKMFVERIVEPDPPTLSASHNLPDQDVTERRQLHSLPPQSRSLDVAPEATVEVTEARLPQPPIPITEQPTINNRGNPIDLPPRIRRKPNFFMAGLIYLLLLGTCNALPSKDGIIIRDTVIFKEQPSISISESSWTVVTDVLLHDAETAIAAVEDHLAKLSQVAHDHHMDGIKFEKDDVRTAWRDTTSFMAANKIDNQVRLMGRTLNDSKTRLATCALTLSGARRPKRGILDLGGTTLKWLFGVSTQADLQDLNSRIEALTNSDKTVIHLLDQHASIINETLQITRSNLALLTELQHQSEILTQRVDYIMDYIKSYELIHVQQ
ncbi:Uncharacterized protein APZ42_033546, partial [Daphnia magna]